MKVRAEFLKYEANVYYYKAMDEKVLTVTIKLWLLPLDLAIHLLKRI